MEFERDIIVDRSKQRHRKDEIKFIVVHYPAMPWASAEKVARYFKRTKRHVSTHFVVDEEKAIQLIELNRVAYHAGTTGAYLCDARNGNSIGIDICDIKVNPKHISVADDDWGFKMRALDNASELIVGLMNQFNIPLSNVIRHFDVTGKVCPRPFVGNELLSAVEIGGNPCTGEEFWNWFKTRISDRINDQQEGKTVNPS